MLKGVLFFIVFCLWFCLGVERKYSEDRVPDPFHSMTTAKIGDNPFPTNPMNDRALGYLLQGKAQTAVSNYGNFINWDEHPMGIWGEYSYLPSVAFLAGVPGQKYSSKYAWNNIEYIMDTDGAVLYGIWESSDAYDGWFADEDTNFVGIIFDVDEDDGHWEPDSIAKKLYVDHIDGPYQWVMDDLNRKIIISPSAALDPNRASSRIGFIYPWALRPDLIRREEEFDFYHYEPISILNP